MVTNISLSSDSEMLSNLSYAKCQTTTLAMHCTSPNAQKKNRPKSHNVTTDTDES